MTSGPRRQVVEQELGHGLVVHLAGRQLDLNRQTVADPPADAAWLSLLHEFDRYKHLQPVFLGGSLLMNAHHTGINHRLQAAVGSSSVEMRQAKYDGI